MTWKATTARVDHIDGRDVTPQALRALAAYVDRRGAGEDLADAVGDVLAGALWAAGSPGRAFRVTVERMEWDDAPQA